MKNKEKFKKEILEIACTGRSLAKKDGRLCSCRDTYCDECDFNCDGNCRDKIKEWCEQEYIEPPKVDWSKVPVDTPIYVRGSDTQDWIPRYFAKYKDGKIFTWIGGRTSFSAINANVESWEYAKLAEPQEAQSDDEKAIEAARLIKEYCLNRRNCFVCTLEKGKGLCLLRNTVPQDWEVEK